MRLLLTIAFLLLSITLYSSNRKAERVLEEGKLLFRLEKASWYGTDHFVGEFPHKRDLIGGYLSYENVDRTITNIFYSQTNPDSIIARYQFDSTPRPQPLSVDTLNHQTTDKESDLISMRNQALGHVNENRDGLFTIYSNTGLNFIPLIRGRERKVYILTAPRQSGVVLIGNDYRLTFDKRNRLRRAEKLHNSLLAFPYRSDDPDSPMRSTVHTHINSDLITATDICTLLLYKGFVEWETHYVIGRKTVSIFNMKEEKLNLFPRKTWDRMNNNQPEK